MASQGKFVSVNLNKSYTRPSSSSPSPGYPNQPSNPSSNGSRPRSGSSGMVILSRPRSSLSSGPKNGPRLAVPPPMNLPSLRKEHERFDVSVSSGRSVANGSSQLGHGSQAMGWTRTSIHEDSAQVAKTVGQRVLTPPNPNLMENKVFVPDSAASSVPQERHLSSVSGSALRGEDFPSLSATFETSKKKRDAINQKMKIKLEIEEPVDVSPRVPPPPQPLIPASTKSKDHSQKRDGSLSDLLSLPAVHSKHKSDWADDERDTRIVIQERDQERGHFGGFSGNSRDFLRTDSYGRTSMAESFSDRGSFSRQNPSVSREMSKGSSNFALSSVQRNDYGESWQSRKTITAPLYGRESYVNRSKGYVSQIMSSPKFPVGDRRVTSEVSKPDMDGDVFDIKGSSLGGLSGDISTKILKRRKDTAKPSDFYDPVRESFEVELQRVQQVQEMERQRVLEEQTRAIEMARREEEEKEKFAREEEERRKKLEEEAKEAEWRAEQERLEASRKAEEQRIAREEEKKKILMEEERRKEAAREKLLELEARIARRQAEAEAKVVEQSPSVSSEGQQNSDFDSVNKIIDAISRTQSSKEGDSPFFAEKVRPNNPWRKDSSSITSTPSAQKLENNSKNVKQDALGTGGAFSRKEFFGSSSLKGVAPENEKYWGDFQPSENKKEFLQNSGQLGWRNFRYSDDQLHSAYASPQDAGTDTFSSFSRSRYSLRQPKVPPPFSFSQRRTNGNINDQKGYQSVMPEVLTVPTLEKLTITEQSEEKTSPRCASQSSLSVTSPPGSQTHLSHDDLEESKELILFSDIDHSPSAIESAEDDEWDIGNDEVQDQEEYEDDENLASADEHIEDKLCDIKEGEITESIQKDLKEEESVDPSVEPSVLVSNQSIPSQAAEVPVNIQFGLFSGPSLIPPPVPAIQIGSIQMPLHLPPVHSSQSPFFQFGQLGYPSIPQGLLPFVHPTLPPTHYSLTHSQITVGPNLPSVENNGQPSQATPSAFDASTKEECPPEKKDESELAAPSEQVSLNARQADVGRRDLASQKSDHIYSRLSSDEKVNNGTRFMNQSGGRGRRYVYKVKNSSISKPLLPDPEDLPQFSSFQRRFSNNGRRGDFRQRDSVNFKERQNFNGKTRTAFLSKNGLRKDGFMDKSNKPAPTSENKTATPQSKEHISKTSRRFEGVENDIDPPVQRGIIRIFKQPGIEAPSDEDDFIEVRSKRQMLNDRREQREKQIKANSRATMKAPRRPRSPNPSYSNKSGLSVRSAERGAAIIPSVISSNSAFDVSTSNVSATQPLAPIGTPSISGEGDERSSRITAATSTKSASFPAIGSRGAKLTSDLVFEKNVIGDGIPWSEQLIEQQVNILTASDRVVKDESQKLSEASNKSIEKLYSSSATSLSSVFPGERIQFGAMNSAKILHPLSRAVSRMSNSEESSPIFLEKERPHQESSITFDHEAEAQAAASAVAVAAIINDEGVGNELGNNVSVSNAQDFQGSHRLDSRQPSAEEPLTVALPADLSVETPTLSLWPPLRNSQSNTGPMISCFPGGPPSHYPCYEVNPMMAPPVFTFSGPHDEAQGPAQAQQLQRSGPGHLGPWPDSFYGPPAGFTGPFISQPLGIQPQPHMLVYNHFTPVGQFGLGFMGTAYIPSGKQPDWKHGSGPSNGGISGNVNVHGNGNLSGGPGEGGASGVSSQQRGAPPLLPMASPLTMFDMSPFQPPGEVPVQTRWSHSVPLTVPPAPFQTDQPTPQFNPAGPADQAVKLPTKPSPRLPDELGLVDPPQTPAIGHTAQSGSIDNMGPTIKILKQSPVIGGGEWYRRQGLPQGKVVKQIYVAKPAAGGSSSSA